MTASARDGAPVPDDETDAVTVSSAVLAERCENRVVVVTRLPLTFYVDSGHNK
ncbi:hypothetical protein ABH917_002908 [Thermobifida halotolerans]